MQRMKWKKWIILVVAMALLLSDVPIVLAKTQSRANESEGVSTIEIDNEMAKQSVSGGEIDQKEISEEMEESVSTYGTESGENEVTVIDNEVIQEMKNTEALDKVGVGENQNSGKKPMRVYVAEGEESYNVNLNHYETSSQPVYSYLFENKKGGLTRAEYISNKFIVEQYNDSFSINGRNTIDFPPNTVFGGFYHGEQYNYIMLGHKDADEENGIPQYELQIFDSEFTLVNTITIDGVNSNMGQPFGTTNVRFEEIDDFLYVRTGHVLGKTDPQAGHQENLYFIFNTSEQVLLYKDDTYKGVAYGDVGHTLNRFLKIDDGNLFVAEQQDFNPGGVYLLKLPLYQSIKESLNYTMAVPMYCDSYVVLSVDGTIGGMETSDDNVLIVGSYKNRGSSEWEKNIFVSVTPINGSTMPSEVIYLTDYEIGSRVVATTPQITKISDNRFLVLWTNYYIPDKEGEIYYDDCEKNTSYLFVDGDGNALSNVMKIDVPMSACQPILYDNNIVWYYTDNSAPMFIQIPVDGSAPVWNPTSADYYKVIINYPEDSQSYSYTYGGEVTLNPRNISGKHFVHWEIVSENVENYEIEENSLKFTMPASTVTISAIYEEDENTNSDTEEEYKEKYNVSFYNKNGEVGDGNYEPGETVTISADTSTPTRKFREWHSIYDDWDGFQSKTSVTTTFVMPECDVYIQPLYDYGHEVTVENGSGDGMYYEGDEVTILADNIKGKKFSYWYFTDKDGRDSFASPQNMFDSITTFEMIDEPVVIKAVYELDTGVNDYLDNNGDDNNTVDNQNNNTPQNNESSQIVKNPVKKLSITAPSKKLAAGKKVKLTVQVVPSNASNKSVTWKTSNKKYATVGKDGQVTIKKAGAGKNVTITAIANDGSGVKESYKIAIMKHAVKSVKLKVKEKSLKVGQQMKISTTILTNGKKANKTLKWTSSNIKYATVSSKGIVTAKKAGKGKTVKITATATDGSGKKDSVKIKIK